MLPLPRIRVCTVLDSHLTTQHTSIPDVWGSAVDQGEITIYRIYTSDSKSIAKDILSVAWTGMEMLLKKVEGCLDGTLAKAPVAAINALIEIKNVHCQSQWTTHLLIFCFRRFKTTRTPSKNSSFKLPKDSSP